MIYVSKKLRLMTKLENIAKGLQIILTDGEDKDIDAIDLFVELLILLEMVDNNINLMMHYASYA